MLTQHTHKVTLCHSPGLYRRAPGTSGCWTGQSHVQTPCAKSHFVTHPVCTAEHLIPQVAGQTHVQAPRGGVEQNVGGLIPGLVVGVEVLPVGEGQGVDLCERGT